MFHSATNCVFVFYLAIMRLPFSLGKCSESLKCMLLIVLHSAMPLVSFTKSVEILKKLCTHKLIHACMCI